MEKTISREAAFRALFQLDFVSCEKDELEFYVDLATTNALSEEEFPEVEKLDKRYIVRIKALIKGTLNNLNKIDELITAYLKKGWSFSRLATTDKNILRLAVYEMRFDEKHLDAPIVINEAVELAKKYGEDKSKNFVNGILASVVKEIED